MAGQSKKDTKKVPAPPMLTMAEIDKLTPEKAAAYWDKVNKYGQAHPIHGQAWLTKFGTLRQNRVMARVNADTATVKTFQTPYIAPDGLSLGGILRDQTTGLATGDLAPGTHLFPGPDDQVRAKYGSQLDTAMALAASTGAAPLTHPARYLSGSELEPINMGADYIMDLQKRLEKGGLLEPGGYVLGVWRSESASAYAQALVDANIADKDVNAIIDDYIKHPKAQDKREPLVTTISNPDDIRAVLQAGAKAMHNTYLSEDEIQRFINGYQNEERTSQTDVYNLGVTGGETVAPAQGEGLSYRAEKAVREGHPNEFMANTFTDRLNEVLGAFTSTPGSATQVGPL